MPRGSNSSVGVCPGGQETQEKGASLCGEGRGAEAPSPQNLQAQKIPASREEGGPPPAGGGAGQPRVLPGDEGARASLPSRAPAGRWLDFLGFSADLVIVVNADGNEEEAAGQEQQDPHGHKTRLSQRGSDHCGRKAGRRQRSEGSPQPRDATLTPP